MYDEILQAVEQELFRRRREGETAVAVDAELLERLRTPVPEPVSASANTDPPPSSPPPAPSRARPAGHDSPGTVQGGDPAAGRPAGEEGRNPGPSSPDQPGTAADWSRLRAEVRHCTRCPLSDIRTLPVVGQGDQDASCMLIGEGPGEQEDLLGIPFVGRAGHLLSRMIKAMGLTRDEVYICNIVKCRPPENRAPAAGEMEACLPYLREQIAWVRPRVIVLLGATALKGLFGARTPGLTRVRGRWQQFEGIPVMPTWHPAYLLRQPAAKKDTWADLQEVMKRLGLPDPH